MDEYIYGFSILFVKNILYELLISCKVIHWET